MLYDFDKIIDRRGTNSIKWQKYPQDVLPLWVADMDFASPETVTRALQERASHPIFGYTQYPESAYEALMAWLKKLGLSEGAPAPAAAAAVSAAPNVALNVALK